MAPVSKPVIPQLRVLEVHLGQVSSRGYVNYGERVFFSPGQSSINSRVSAERSSLKLPFEIISLNRAR